MKKIFLALTGLIGLFFSSLIFSVVRAAEKKSADYLNEEEATAVKEAYRNKWLQPEIRWNLRGFAIFTAIIIFVIVAKSAGIEIAAGTHLASVGLTLLVQSRKKIAS